MIMEMAVLFAHFGNVTVKPMPECRKWRMLYRHLMWLEGNAQNLAGHQAVVVLDFFMALPAVCLLWVMYCWCSHGLWPFAEGMESGMNKKEQGAAAAGNAQVCSPHALAVKLFSS